MNRRRYRFIGLIVAVIGISIGNSIWGSSLLAQGEQASDKGASEKGASEKGSSEKQDEKGESKPVTKSFTVRTVTAEGTVAIDGQDIAYTVETGTLTQADDKGKRKRKFFSVPIEDPVWRIVSGR